VDIVGRRIQALDPATGEHRLWPLMARPTSLALRAADGALVGTERHICRWDWHGEPEPLVEVEPDLPMNRLNEGAVGPDGAFWVGTMHQNIGDDDGPSEIPGPTGRLYRYALDGTLARVCDDRFGIANTLVWPAPDRLVTADTLANVLYEYRIGEAGHLTDRRTLMEGFPRGLPDGSTLDAEGFVWTARVAGGGCLTRTAPDGRIDRVVDLPCSWPTSCAFGDPGLGTLYVTSARFTLSPEHLALNPQEGGLFALDVGVAGLPARRFGAPA
jgi:sugar lactone lactonase YvrE